jgi:glucose/arabinose dehydrogenase
MRWFSLPWRAFLVLVSSTLLNPALEIPAGLKVPSSEPALGYTLIEPFPSIKFEQPVAVVSASGFSNSLFVVERFGKIYAITNLNNPDKTLFLNLADSTITAPGLEVGLLGLAFHPNFAENGQYFVYRCVIDTGGNYNRLSRFRVLPGQPFASDPASEEIILQQRDYSINFHNAGDIHFGSDGYLYLSIGEGSPAPEDLAITRQPIDKSFFGTIIRIDVDKRRGNLPPNPYRGSVNSKFLIPSDNPFIGVTNYQGVSVNRADVRTEIFALGLRNPWRFSIDPITGELFCGDVGESSYEEVNLIEKGKNYGWPYREGAQDTGFFPSEPPGFASIDPIHSYYHGNLNNDNNSGQAVIGGHVYRGTAIPQLYGAYLFGDNVRGHIWALFRDAVHGTNSVQWLTGEPNLSTFGIDPRDGEVLLASLVTGRIKKLIYRDPALTSFPRLLSETGIFDDLKNLLPAAGVEPYSVNAPFWSDHADKKRWALLSHSDPKIEFSPSNHWTFPEGTIWVKHFEIEQKANDPSTTRRLETRLLVKTASDVYGVTYKWNAAGTDAELLRPEGLNETFTITEADSSQRVQSWHYPSRLECRTCHNITAGFALGFNTAQLNMILSSNVNQLNHLSDLGFFKQPIDPGPNFPAMAAVTNTEYSPEFRVRSYLGANCVQCHNPDNAIIATWDARFHTAWPQKNVIGNLIVPRDLYNSSMYSRLANLDQLHMPPIATAQLNPFALDLLRDWIRGFPSKPWIEQDSGSPPDIGSASVVADSLEIASYAGVDAAAEAAHLLVRPSKSSAQFLATVKLHPTSPLSARAGIFIGSSPNFSEGYFFGMTATNIFSRTPGAPADKSLASNISREAKLRVVREGSALQSFVQQGGAWQLVDSANLAESSDPYVGGAVSASSGVSESYASFNQYSLMMGALEIEAGTNTIAFPDHARINCNIEQENDSIRQVEFFVNDELVSTTTRSPYTLDFAPPDPGEYSFIAKITDSQGLAIQTTSLKVTFSTGPSVAWFFGEDNQTLGSWENRFGKEAYLSPLFHSALERPQVKLLSGAVKLVPGAEQNEIALKMPGSETRSSSIWGPSEIRGEVLLRDTLLHRVAFYFADLNEAGISETLTILDAYSGKEITRTNVTEIGGGKYLIFLVRGSISFVIQAPGDATSLAGVFVDASPVELPKAELPAIPTKLFTSAPFSLTPQLTSGITLSHVNWYLDGKLLQSATNSPFRANLQNVGAGNHTISLTAFDLYGQPGNSLTQGFTSLLPPATCRFLGTDDKTRGNWIGVYGAEGYILPGDSTNVSKSIDVQPSGAFVYQWNPSDPESAPLRASGDDRVAAVWVAPWGFDTEVSLNDGLPHQMAFYVFDDPGAFKVQTLQVLDGASGEVLDERTVENFIPGLYYKFLVQGAIKLRLTTITGASVISGLFFEKLPGSLPHVVITEPVEHAEFDLSAGARARLDYSKEGGRINRIGVYSGDQLLNEKLAVTTEIELPGLLQGDHWLTAYAVDENGVKGVSSPVLVHGTSTISSAQFFAADAVHFGNWKGVFGKEGYVVAGDSTNTPYSFNYSFDPSTLWLFLRNPADQYALQGNYSSRIAIAWYSPGLLKMTADFLDGQYHLLTFYILGYYGGPPVMNLTLRGGSRNSLLDSRTLTDFTTGKYFSWKAKGHLQFELTGTGGVPFINGIFLDSAASFADWKANYFTPAEQSNEAISGPMADPDQDGISNLLEYSTGSNPMRPNPLWQFITDGVQGEAVFRVQLSRDATGVSPVIATSKDLRSWSSPEEFGLKAQEQLTPGLDILSYSIKQGDSQGPLFFRFYVDITNPQP